MNYNNLLLSFLLLIIIHKLIRKVSEKFTCPNIDISANKDINQLKESKRDGLINDRKLETKRKLNEREQIISDIIKSSYSNGIKWILDKKNTFTWDKINMVGNKVRLTKIQKGQSLKISNIQIWGTEENTSTNNDTKPRNWVESDEKYGPVTIEMSSKEGLTNKPINVKDIKFVKGPNSLSNENKTDNTSSVTCPELYNMTSCNCYSGPDPQNKDNDYGGAGGTCNGAEIKNIEKKATCIAYDRDGGQGVQAHAICTKLNYPIDDIKYDVKSDPPDDPESVKCPDTHPDMLSCNCTTSTHDNQNCKGSNIELENNIRYCRAYRNSDYDTSKVIAKATCAKIPDSRIRSTLQDNNLSDINDGMSDSSGVATTKCKWDEHLIGCNCYAVTDNIDVSKKASICNGAYVQGNLCKADSYWKDNTSLNKSYPVYADATCAKFNISGEQCIDNELYGKKEKNGSYTDSSCKTKSDPDEFQYIQINLPVNVNIKRIVIYNADFSPKYNSKNKLYPIKVEIMKNNNTVIYGTQKYANSQLIRSDALPAIPTGDKYPNDFYRGNDIGIAGYYRGWHNVHSKEHKSFCRILPIQNNLFKELNCVNPVDDVSLDRNIRTIPRTDLGIPHTQYMADETGNGYDDFCRCVPNKENKNRSILKCIQGDPKLHFNEEFEPADKFLTKDCQKYTGEELKNINKHQIYTDCETTLQTDFQYSIDASFYNEKNQRYYIFKNIRIDFNKFVLFCEVTLDHKIVEGYPQLVSKKYWGNLNNVFLEHIDETIYGKNDIVYFISGRNVCAVSLDGKTGQPFYVDKIVNINKKRLNTLIERLPSLYSSNITTGFYTQNKSTSLIGSDDIKITLIKNTKFIDIQINKQGKLIADKENNILSSRIVINDNSSNLKLNNINTILSFYNTSETMSNQYLIYIFSNDYLYKYDLFDNIIKETTKIIDLYPNLTWKLPNKLQYIAPSPVIKDNLQVSDSVPLSNIS